MDNSNFILHNVTEGLTAMDKIRFTIEDVDIGQIPDR